MLVVEKTAITLYDEADADVKRVTLGILYHFGETKPDVRRFVLRGRFMKLISEFDNEEEAKQAFWNLQLFERYLFIEYNDSNERSTLRFFITVDEENRPK